ncbi:hypothetical protein IAT38_000188 [Cryptococcus sp. DSM 104549]
MSVCLRPGCDIPMAGVKDGIFDDNDVYDYEYIPRSLMGRRVYYHMGVRKEFVLIRWKDWEAYDSTWEPPEGLPPTWLRSETDDLANEAAEEGRDITKTHVFIRPRARKWFTPDGKYRTREIFEVTGKSRSWWWKKWSDRTAPLWWGSEPELEKTYPAYDDSW